MPFLRVSAVTFSLAAIVAMGCKQQEAKKDEQKPGASGTYSNTNTGTGNGPATGGSTKTTTSGEVVGDGTPTSSFLTLADFPSANTPAVKDTVLESTINDSSEFFATSPDSTSSFCATKFDAIPIQVIAGKISMSADLDITDCMPSSSAKITGAKFKFFQSISCDSYDFSSFKGKTMAGLRTIMRNNPCMKKGVNAQVLQNVKMTYTSTSGGKTTTTTTVIGQFAPPTGDPCKLTYTASSYKVTNCSFMHYRTSTSGTTTTVQAYQKIDSNGTVYKNAETYYHAGTMPFVINNWKGTMTYTDATTPPSWVAKTAKGSSASGTFSGPSAGLANKISVNGWSLAPLRP